MIKLATARSWPNIALIKYWGNRKNEFRLPAADSLSMTLDRPSVEITVESSAVLEITSYRDDGEENVLTEKDVRRFQSSIDLMRRYILSLQTNDVVPPALAITIRSHIPSSIGLASSAAVFSCLAKALAELIRSDLPLTDEQISVLARLGSGSAARSIYGGYVALPAGSGNDLGSSAARQIADEHHWPLYDVIIVPSTESKKVGSTEGHALAQTSPFFQKRIEEIGKRRQQECVDAILKRDFEKLQHVSEEDALDMHRVMETSTPPLRYLTSETHRIIREVEELRMSQHLPVLSTMDAGPTVHLLCEEEAAPAIRAYAQEQRSRGCVVFEAKTGGGATVVHSA